MVKNVVRALVSGREPATTMKGSTLMSTTRILWTLLLTGTLALAATGTQAQSIAQPGQSQERQDSRSDEHSKLGRPWGIVGSWFGTTATGIRQLITFHADGTVLRSVPGEVSIDPARPPHTAAHGVWRYLGKGRFGVTIWDLFYDVNTAQPLRYNRLRLEVTLGDDRDDASARAIVETIDLQGVVVGSRTGSANFVRIPFEPLE
jgi:hypothetical protein